MAEKLSDGFHAKTDILLLLFTESWKTVIYFL